MIVAGFVIVGVVGLLFGAATVATETDWGRRQIGHIVESQVNNRLAQGEKFRMGTLRGGLGGSWSVDSVSLTDSAGHPVISATRITADASVVGLMRGNIQLRIGVIEGARARVQRSEERRGGNEC